MLFSYTFFFLHHSCLSSHRVPSAHSYIISLSSPVLLSPSLSLSPLLSSPPPPTVWTAAVFPQPPVFLSAASAGEGSPSCKKPSSPPQPPPTLPAWLTPASGIPAHKHTRTHAKGNDMRSVAMKKVDLNEGQRSRDKWSGGGGVTHTGTR